MILLWKLHFNNVNSPSIPQKSPNLKNPNFFWKCIKSLFKFGENWQISRNWGKSISSLVLPRSKTSMYKIIQFVNETKDGAIK